MKKSTKIVLIVLGVLVAIYSYTHLSSYLAKRKTKNQGVTVAVSAVKQQDVTVPLQTIGNVQAYTTVSVMSLVDGELLRVGFNQGDFVKKGQLLFVIDPRPFQAQLQKAQADLAKDQAQLENADLQLKRTNNLAKKGYLSQQDYDQLVTNKKSLAATVAADQSAIASAQLQLTYATITSPIDGRTGSLLVNAGNIVKSNSETALVTITQVTPIYIAFAVPEQYLAAILAEQRKHLITVQASVGADVEQGQLTFIDNTVDATTGTIKLKATFANTNQRLWPGQFVTVTLPTATLYHALLVPSRAIQMGQSGSYVYVVQPDQTVTYRNVKVGPMVNNFTVITQGLKLHDQVVTDGQERLTEGAAIKIVADPTAVNNAES